MLTPLFNDEDGINTAFAVIEPPPLKWRYRTEADIAERRAKQSFNPSRHTAGDWGRSLLQCSKGESIAPPATHRMFNIG